ncbi:4Fe-4S binding protein [Patescibacteria group bacterium]|nr:4Fe-4S binding protein [Patescibacteria group bacterium]
MCEFCAEHGDGKIWYKNVENYATELLEDLERSGFIEQFFHTIIKDGGKNLSIGEKALKIPLLGRFIQRRATNKLKKIHFTQTVPKEDASEILRLANTIVRIACGCSWEAEKKERRVCIGVSFGPPHWYKDIDTDYFGSPDVGRLESLTTEEAIHLIERFDAKGLVHNIFTMHTPFIGGICNCDKKYCLALRFTNAGFPTVFRAEYLAHIDEEKCDGCRACVKRCKFDAINFLPDRGKCFVDYKKCFGCGLCRVRCEKDAIVLVDRRNTEAKEIWL